MQQIYTSAANHILEREGFLGDYQTLFASYISSLIGDESEDIAREIAMRLTRSAQIFVASGEPEKIQIGIRIIDMFLELSPPYLEDLLIIAEEVFLSLGDFPNIALIDSRWRDRSRISRSLSGELAAEMHRSINAVEDLGIDGTNFQVDLWNSLEEGLDVVTIAPTSTGKSFMIMQHVVHSILRVPDQITYAVFVVPSRALIHEVSKKIQQILAKMNEDSVEVASVGQKERSYDRSTIFVLTQERLLMLLHFQPLMAFSYVVIDEAQNIAGDNRGVLLHIALSRIMERGRLQLVFSTPSEDYRDAFSSLLGEARSILHSEQSPVSKNIIEVSCKGRQLVLRSSSPDVEVSVPKGFRGTNLESIVLRLGRGNSNLIYANTIPRCTNITKKLAESELLEEKEELDDAANYIRTTVHDEYSLADSIRKGVAFHFGPLPRNIRIMIENEVESGTIDYLVCTSTLAEGVNLPAKNLFIHDPKIVGETTYAMPKVQYKNIVGRAGRLMTHFSGNVFLVNFDTWDYPECTSDTVEPKLPTYFRMLQENTNDVLACIRGEIFSPELSQEAMFATINKVIQDIERGTFDASVREYLTEESRVAVNEAIEELLDNIEVPPAILALNPGIGVLEQNRLLEYLMQHEDLLSLQPIHPRNPDFFDYIVELADLLHHYGLLRIRSLENELYLKKLCRITVSWAKGAPFKDIIRDARRFSKSDRNAPIDTVVRKLVKMIDGQISFKLAVALKCFSQIYIFCAEQQDINTDDMIEVYPYLEIGACDPLMVRLISSGLTRQTAIEVSGIMRDLEIDDGDLVGQVMMHDAYRQLHRITRKEIETLRI